MAFHVVCCDYIDIYDDKGSLKGIFEGIWLSMWFAATILIFMIDTSETFCVEDREWPGVVKALCRDDFKLHAERMVLIYSALGILHILCRTLFPPVLKSRVVSPIHIDKNNVQMCDWITLSMHMLHLVLLCAKPVRLSALFILMLMLYALAIHRSINTMVYTREINVERYRRSEAEGKHSPTEKQNRALAMCAMGVSVVRILLIGKLLFFMTGHHYKFSSLQVNNINTKTSFYVQRHRKCKYG
jgi:hypothetical protein